MHCLSLDDPDNVWSFCPSVGASIFFAVLFGLSTFVHLGQGVFYRKGYTWVVIMGASWETLTFIFRTLNIYDQKSTTYYQAWFILILIAPLWINAFVYMAMGRMVYNFSSRQKIWVIPGHRFGLYFVLLDIAAFITQVLGAGMASGDTATYDQIMRGIHIYMGGVGLQQFFILIFLALAVAFHRELATTGAPVKAWRMLYAIYTVLVLITIRIVFRLIEYSSGITGSIPNREAYMYCLDALPMCAALVVLNVIHPGAVMPGKESDMPSRKERKRRAAANLNQSCDDNSPMQMV